MSEVKADTSVTSDELVTAEEDHWETLGPPRLGVSVYRGNNTDT